MVNCTLQIGATHQRQKAMLCPSVTSTVLSTDMPANYSVASLSNDATIIADAITLAQIQDDNTTSGSGMARVNMLMSLGIMQALIVNY